MIAFHHSDDPLVEGEWQFGLLINIGHGEELFAAFGHPVSGR
jgi:hypothetical protein